MRRTALLGLLPLSAALLAGCGHHGSTASPPPVTSPSGSAGTSSPAPAAGGSGRSSSASPEPGPTAASSAAGTGPTAPTSTSTSGPAAGGVGPATAAPPAGSTASAQGLDRPAGSFAATHGISGVMTTGGLVSGFSDTFSPGRSLSAATAALTAYLPAGTTYGASTTSGACRTVQLLGAKHPTDVAFCSDTTGGAGSSTYTAASIAEITVSADAGLG